MEKRVINPWKWQDQRNYVQAVEVQNVQSTLYCSGQAAINYDGKSSNADMKTQVLQALQNLEQLIIEAGYELKNIVKLNIFTTSEEELFQNFDIFQYWISKNQIQQTTTLISVKGLFETLKVEFEAIAVK